MNLPQGLHEHVSTRNARIERGNEVISALFWSVCGDHVILSSVVSSASVRFISQCFVVCLWMGHGTRG